MKVKLVPVMVAHSGMSLVMHYSVESNLHAMPWQAANYKQLEGLEVEAVKMCVPSHGQRCFRLLGQCVTMIKWISAFSVP